MGGAGTSVLCKAGKGNARKTGQSICLWAVFLSLAQEKSPSCVGEKDGRERNVSGTGLSRRGCGAGEVGRGVGEGGANV